MYFYFIDLPWTRKWKSQIWATCCQRTASLKVDGEDGFAANVKSLIVSNIKEIKRIKELKKKKYGKHETCRTCCQNNMVYRQKGHRDHLIL